MKQAWVRRKAAGWISPLRGKTHNDALKKRISDTVKAWHRAHPEHAIENSIRSRGRVYSSETRAKMNKDKIGKPLSFAHRLKMSVAHNKNKLPAARTASSLATITAFKEGRCGRPPKYFESTKNGTTVIYRSKGEKLLLDVLETSPFVIKYECEPFILRYRYESATFYYLPDVLVHYVNGQSELIEVKSTGWLPNAKETAKHNWANVWCQHQEYKFRVLLPRQILAFAGELTRRGV